MSRLAVDLNEALAIVSRWLDEAPVNVGRDPEAATWGRLAKVAEECGEVVAAYIGTIGANPRKGVTHSDDDVCEELLDVALTALAAYEHMTGNHGTCIDALRVHTAGRLLRIDIDVEIRP